MIPNSEFDSFTESVPTREKKKFNITYHNLHGWDIFISISLKCLAI